MAEDQSLVLDIERLYGADASVEVDIEGALGIETRQLDGLRGPWRFAFSGAPGHYFFRVRSSDAVPVEVEGAYCSPATRCIGICDVPRPPTPVRSKPSSQLFQQL